MTRIETDFIGEKLIPSDSLYGINSVRAKENFPIETPFHIEWYKAVGTVKQACLITALSFKNAVTQKHPEKAAKLKLPNTDILNKLIESAVEVGKGEHFEHFITPAIQGGAGTSINMNVNEILANLSLIKLNEKPGNYQLVNPIEHANIYQSTNDVIPTALKVASMQLLNNLETEINYLREKLEKLETTHRNTIRVAHTQLQQAVPASYGQFFGSFNDALSRDWWRVSKSLERIKEVNLGGGATGTGLSIPRYYILEVVPELKKITALPITQSENLTENTSNLDSLVEVHAILKAHAVNLEKMVSDIRLLSADINGKKEISIAPKQLGSSIMPGKVNPVIAEFVIAAAHKIYANDTTISTLAAQGNLDLNANTPLIGHCLLESIKLLIACDQTITNNLINGLTINTKNAEENLYKSPAVCVALSPIIGYSKAGLLAKYMKEKQCTIFEANNNINTLSIEKLNELMKPGNLLQKGFSINDIT